MISDFVQLSIVSHFRHILIKIKKTKQKVNSISIGHTRKSPLSYPGGDFQGGFTIKGGWQNEFVSRQDKSKRASNSHVRKERGFLLLDYDFVAVQKMFSISFNPRVY